MTSVAFIMGVVPLVFSTGAGFEIRQAMGIAVFAGMLGVTAFGLFFTPVFFVSVSLGLVERISNRRRQRAAAVPAAAMVEETMIDRLDAATVVAAISLRPPDAGAGQ